MSGRVGEGRSVLVALSGGVDSAVAAMECVRAGRRVEAFFLDMLPGDLSVPGRAAAWRVARRLEIPLHTVSAARLLAREVISYFIEAYLAGTTPNPCVVCNPRVKLAAGLDLADRLGLDGLATGHYAGARNQEDGSVGLFKARDQGKDQSYFLHQVRKEVLPRLEFPLSGLTKAEVRARAETAGLSDCVIEESREVCFLRGDYRAFLEERGVFQGTPGDVVTAEGDVVGRHRGLHAYTVGQRRGVGIPDVTPYYVLALDRASNRLVVGKEGDLCRLDLAVEEVNWLVAPEIAMGAPCLVKIRARHRGDTAWLVSRSGGGVAVRFEAAQKAVTPGQFAVFYHGDRVLGGGRICG